MFDSAVSLFAGGDSTYAFAFDWCTCITPHDRAGGRLCPDLDADRSTYFCPCFLCRFEALEEEVEQEEEKERQEEGQQEEQVGQEGNEGQKVSLPFG
jgi:hypothetical protein